MTKNLLREQDFLQLSEPEQFELLHRDGVHIGKRIVAGQTVILLQLYGFYVEVHYRQYRKIIDHILTSEETDILHPYLNQIHVRDLKRARDND